MSVEHILGQKGRDVVTVSPERTVGDVAAMLSQHRIGAIVVTDDGGRVLGIVSERDVVRAVATGGGAALDQAVQEQMTRRVVTCGPATGIDEIMGLMTDGKFRHVPVVDGGKLGGIVSIGDVVKHRLAEVESEHQAMRDYIATA